MTCVLDTSAYSAFNRGDGRLRKWFHADNEIIMPLVVVAELRAGFAAGSRNADNEKLLQRFLDSPNVSTAGITDATTKCFAEIFVKLRAAGTPIGLNDLWIAAVSLELDQPLLTLDSGFSNIADLQLAKI